MMGLSQEHLAEALVEDRLHVASARADIRRARELALQAERDRHQRQRRLVGLSLLLIDRASRR
jgi:hypothetical protein